MYIAIWVSRVQTFYFWGTFYHYSDVIMGVMESQINSLTIVYSKLFRCRSKKTPKLCVTGPWPFVRGIHRSPVNSTHKGPVTRKMFPFDDVIVCEFQIGLHHTMRPSLFNLKRLWVDRLRIQKTTISTLLQHRQVMILTCRTVCSIRCNIT